MHRPAFGDSVHIIHGVLCRYLPTEKLLSSNNLLRVPYSVQYITLLLKFSIHALLSFFCSRPLLSKPADSILFCAKRHRKQILKVTESRSNRANCA